MTTAAMTFLYINFGVDICFHFPWIDKWGGIAESYGNSLVSDSLPLKYTVILQNPTAFSLLHSLKKS